MVVLTFDLEEFDIPLEYGQNISIDDQLTLAATGTYKILDILRETGVKATFFVTVVFAERFKDIIFRIISEGHELASHGYSHSSFQSEDVLKSKTILEKISGKDILGFRMPRLQNIDVDLLVSAGYEYDSSISPTFLPGRYNHLRHTTGIIFKNGLYEIPVSVTKHFRFPLFWLTFHLLPYFIYRFLVKRTLKNTGFLNLYFHPWEFLEESLLKSHGLPFYICMRSGITMEKRMVRLIRDLTAIDSFGSCKDLLAERKHG